MRAATSVFKNDHMRNGSELGQFLAVGGFEAFFDDNDFDATVVVDIGIACCRGGGIDGDIGRTGLKDAKDRSYAIGAFAQVDAHAVASTDAHSRQPVTHAVRQSAERDVIDLPDAATF